MRVDDNLIELYSSATTGFRGIYRVGDYQKGHDSFYSDEKTWEREEMQKIHDELLNNDFEGIQHCKTLAELKSWCKKHKFEPIFFYDGNVVAEKVYEMSVGIYSVYYSFAPYFSKDYFEVD